jgi:hypothetical protein
LVFVEPFKNAKIKNSLQNFMGRAIQAESIFTTITLFIKLTKINSIDHGGREEREWQ